MNILAIDTATRACSVARMGDGEIAARLYQEMDRGHAEALMPMVAKVMGESAYSDLDLIAVTMGPGAFTGLRIGLAAARGIALAADLPCIGVTTFDAIAGAVPAAGRVAVPLLVVLDTKRAGVIYAQAFGSDLAPVGEGIVATGADISSLAATVATEGGAIEIAGDGSDMAGDILEASGFSVIKSRAPELPDAAVVAEIAAARWHPVISGTLPPVRPLYLGPVHAKIPKNAGRRRP